MYPESIYYLFEPGSKAKQEDFMWPVAGKASLNDRVFIICDGDGSFSNGGIASKLICQFMAAKVSKYSEQRMSGELINKLLIEARDQLIIYAWKYRLDTNLSTTFSMLILYDQKVFISWFGDSRIYHVRGGDILFRSENNSLVEPIKNTAFARGIKTDRTPISAATKWIKDVREGDYILLCSKGLVENVKDDDIKLLISQNDKADIDLTGSFRRLTVGKTVDNYSMYLIRVHEGAQKKSIKDELIALRNKTSGLARPAFIFAMSLSALIILIFFIRKTATPKTVREYKNQTSQPVDVLRNDSVPSAIVISAPRKPIVKASDSVKIDSENLPAAPEEDQSGEVPTEETSKPTNPVAPEAKPAAAQSVTEKPVTEKPVTEKPVTEKPVAANPLAAGKKIVAQLVVKLTTDESCKLKITNLDLNEVIDWDLSQNDDGTIYLKPGKYSILATSMISSSKTKTYNFDVKPGSARATQKLHIKF
jgi:protein phosphatase